MGQSRLPGPIRQEQHPLDIDDGTSARLNSPDTRPTGKAEHEELGSHEGAHGHDLVEEAGHLAHYAHELHLAAEAVEFAGHTLHKAVHFVEHAQASRKFLKAVGQMAYDLRRMRQVIRALENVAKQGGQVGAKAAEKLIKAKEAYEGASAAFQREKVLVKGANEVLRDFKTVQSGLKGTAMVKLGQAAARLETALQGSRIGRGLLTTGRIAASKPVVKGLVVVGAALEGVASFADSTAQTTAGKSANAALGAGTGALIMMNPLVAGADVLAPRGYKLSEVYHGGAGAVTAIGEGLLTYDTKAMDDFHKRSMEGHYGKVMQAASEAGEYWAEKGVAGGLKEFADAVRWWVSH